MPFGWTPLSFKECNMTLHCKKPVIVNLIINANDLLRNNLDIRLFVLVDSVTCVLYLDLDINKE